MNKFNRKDQVSFRKEEINQIMEIYSKKISIGEWKDYSITFRNDHAVFSIHKSYKLEPTFQIKKNLYRKKNFTLTSHNNIIKTSNSLTNLISYLKKPTLKLVK